MVTEQAALAELLKRLKAEDYRFVAVTPATHQRVLGREWTGPPTLRDIFGWSRPFEQTELDPELLALLHHAGAVDQDLGRLRSRVRVASLAGDLFLHSAYPTDSSDAVFFGPDTYRFARFIGAKMSDMPVRPRILDMGAGSGAGGIVAARAAPGADLTLVDVNPAALHLARANAAAAELKVETVEADRIPTGHNVILANPPYMIDMAGRAYRDGGGLYGGEVAVAWTRQALEVLPPGGALLLYTGAAVVNGSMPLFAELHALSHAAGARLEIEEIDPDVFGEELDSPGYAEVERIAAVGVVITQT